MKALNFEGMGFIYYDIVVIVDTPLTMGI